MSLFRPISSAGSRLCFPLLLALTLSAQTPTGQITGRITDASGAVIPSATITVTSVDNGIARRAQSNESGYYTFSLVRPGDYSISAESEGFRSVHRTGVSISVDQVARIDFTMEVGAVTETIEVTGAAPTIESETSSLGTVVDSKQMTDIPLNSRNTFRLAFLVPGFMPTRNFSDQFNRASSFRINGGRSNMNDAYIDGISNSPPASNGFLSYAAFPSPDVLQEFKVQTNSYSAEYGRTNGGVLNMVMRSGTNEFHGVFYEFLRNSKMDANDFFANRSGTPLASFKRNQFGVAGGGPIVRDKAFFFMNYEGLRQRQAANQTNTFPTLLEKSGDYSSSAARVGGACVPAQIFDPMSTRAAAGGGFTRDVFPNARIPQSRLDPVAANIVDLYPNPTQAGDPCTGVNNHFSSKSGVFDSNQLDAKLDWAPTDRDRMFGGFSYRLSKTFAPNYYGNYANPTFQTAGFEIPNYSYRFDYTRIQSPSLILNVRAGFTRVTQDSPPVVPDGFSLTDLGFPQSLADQVLQPATVPRFQPAGFSQLGIVWASPLETFQTYSLVGSATATKGKHTVKFGADLRLNQVGSNLKQYTSGLYQFSRAMTQGPNPNTARSDLGNSIASMMLGAGSGGYTQIVPSVFTSNNYTGLYVQDDFKLTPRITLNLGLRYNVENGKGDRFNQLTWFDYDVASPLAGQLGMPDLRGGVRFEGLDGDRQYPTDWNNLAPRFGLAYSLNSKTTIRGGYGVFYPPYVGQAGNSRASEGSTTQTSWVTSIDGVTPENLLSNPYPNGLLAPTGSSLGLLTNVGQNQGDSIDRNSVRSSYVQQWNFNIQRELPGRIAAEVAYVGNKGTKLTDGGWEMNQLRPELLSMGTELQRRVGNPFYGVIGSGPLAGPQVALGQLLRPYPQYATLTNFRPTSASSIYHAVQVRVQKQFSSGLGFLVSYTGGKLIDDSIGVGAGGAEAAHLNAYNRALDRAVSPLDISQRLVFSYNYELPVGAGKAFGSSWPGWAKAALGDWQVNGIFSWNTGFPLLISAPNNTNAFSATQRPDISHSAKLSGDRSTDDKLSQWFDTTVFSQPAAFTFGNAPRSLPDARTPPTAQLDFSMYKDFPFGEKRRLQFRAEFFNFTNTPNWAPPGTAFGAGNFGVIGALGNTPRQVQLALKLYL